MTVFVALFYTVTAIVIAGRTFCSDQAVQITLFRSLRSDHVVQITLFKSRILYRLPTKTIHVTETILREPGAPRHLWSNQSQADTYGLTCNF